MPHFAPNKMPASVKRRYFELIRAGWKGAGAARAVGVSTSCGSLWFIDAGSVRVAEAASISPRFLSQDDRLEIADGLSRGDPVKVIAARVGKSYQSVYREIQRNSKPGGGYQPWFAHNQAHLRRRRGRQRILQADAALREAIEARLRRRWSPEQICRWLARRYPRRPAWHICWETIYDALYLGILDRRLTARLRTGRSFRHRRGRGRSSFPRMPQMRSIHQRPRHVESRRQAGHWEGDLIIGAQQQSAIATLVERKTRFTILVALRDGHKAAQVRAALSLAMNTLPPSLKRTLTWDQGFEMYEHPQLATDTGTAIYFADPHSPWQRGTNENTNKLLRQYFPKTTDLRRWDQAHLDRVAEELNTRPRKGLRDRTPDELMRRLRQPGT
jgi:transposase, IS30 family